MSRRWITALAAVMAAFLPGCPVSPTSDDHGHDHEEGGHPHAEAPIAQVTVWDDRYEIFLEHRYIVANKKVNFVTQITDRTTGEPRREGPVTFRLSKGAGAAQSYDEEKPRRDGVYIPTLLFPEPGEWNVSLLIPDAGEQRTVELPPFSVHPSQQDADQATAHRDAPPAGIDFLKEQQWKIGLQTEAATQKNISERLRLTGVVRPASGRSADVSSVVAGRLLAPEQGRFPAVGDWVEEGQVLALVQPPLAGSDLLSYMGNKSQISALQVELTTRSAEAEAAMEQASVALEHAQKVYERTKELHEQGAKSTRELEEARHELDRARKDVEAAKTLQASYRKGRTELDEMTPQGDLIQGFPVVEMRAPISGTITQVNAVVGEHALPEEHVLHIRDTSVVFIEAKVPETDISKLSSSGSAIYETPDKPGNFHPILNGADGRLIYQGQEVDPRSRTIPLVYELANSDGRLRLGMALNVHIETHRSTDTLVIPRKALIQDEGQSVAFVQVSGELFQKRYLQLGIIDGEQVEVLSGVEPGEQVVTDGAFAVRLASVATSVPAHGHVH